MKYFTLSYTGESWRRVEERSRKPMEDRHRMNEMKVARALKHGSSDICKRDLQGVADLEIGESFIDNDGDTWTRTA